VVEEAVVRPLITPAGPEAVVVLEAPLLMQHALQVVLVVLLQVVLLFQEQVVQEEQAEHQVTQRHL
jgi:hypothetical protein